MVMGVIDRVLKKKLETATGGSLQKVRTGQHWYLEPLDFAHMKERGQKKEGKKVIDFTNTITCLLSPPQQLHPCCMHLRMSWLFPSHSCHTQKTRTRFPFPTSSHRHSNLACFSFLLYSNTSILSALFSCSFALNLSAAFLAAVSSTVFFFFFFFAQKCCFFVNFAVVCLFVCFFDLLVIGKLLQVHSNSTEF